MNYDTYGSKSSDLHGLRLEMERILGINFTLHDSDHFNGEYFKAKTIEQEIFYVLDNEAVDEEGEVLYPEFEQFRTIVEVSRTVRGDKLREKLGSLEGLEFIRRKSRT